MSGNVVQKNKTFASVVVDMAESGPKWPPPPATSVSPAAGTSSPTGGWTESQERDNVVAGGGTSDQSQQGPMEEEGDGSLKRVRDSEQDSSWITPNKTAKSRLSAMIPYPFQTPLRQSCQLRIW